MAQDATGTPTSLGIPTYNTQVDAPSGKGFNAAMAAIDALIAAAPSKPAGIVSGEVPVWNGSTWVRSSVTNIGPTSLGSGTPDNTKFLRGDGVWAAVGGVTTGTSLPGSPTDGQLFMLTDSTSASTWTWLFRYNSSAASAKKWEFIGGAPMKHEIATAETTTSTSYVDLTTVGPTLTIPNTGDYEIVFGAIAGTTAGSGGPIVAAAVKLGSAATSDTEGVFATPSNNVATSQNPSRFMVRSATASDVWKVQYRVVSGTTPTASFQGRFLMVRPIRIQ